MKFLAIILAALVSLPAQAFLGPVNIHVYLEAAGIPEPESKQRIIQNRSADPKPQDEDHLSVEQAQNCKSRASSLERDSVTLERLSNTLDKELSRIEQQEAWQLAAQAFGTTPQLRQQIDAHRRQIADFNRASRAYTQAVDRAIASEKSYNQQCSKKRIRRDTFDEVCADANNPFCKSFRW